MADWTAEKWNPFAPEPIQGFLNQALDPNPDLETWETLLHMGAVDLRQAPGARVYSVRKGVPSFPVVRPGESKLEGWTTTVQVRSDDGILTYFMHLDPKSIPKSLISAIEAKRPIEAGTFLGTLYRHETLPSHVHFGAADCVRHVRLNPQTRVDYRDSSAPTVARIVVHRPKDEELKDLGATVSGDVELTAFAYDTIDGLSEQFSLNRLDLEISSKERGVLYRAKVFDATRIPSPAPATDHTCEIISDYDGYEPEMGAAIYRDFAFGGQEGWTYSLTQTKEHLPPYLKTWFRPFPGPWQTKRYPNGTYLVRVRAFDAKGNTAALSRTIEIAN